MHIQRSNFSWGSSNSVKVLRPCYICIYACMHGLQVATYSNSHTDHASAFSFQSPIHSSLRHGVINILVLSWHWTPASSLWSHMVTGPDGQSRSIDSDPLHWRLFSPIRPIPAPNEAPYVGTAPTGENIDKNNNLH